MAKSSIHIENGNAGFLAHNDRSKATVNSIFKQNKNEIWNSKEDAFKMYRFELAARSDAYSKRTHQKLQKKTTTHLSAIVNLNENHNLDDVKKVASLLERELDTKVFQIVLHRDEGHINDEGEEVVNYHAHLEFMGLDQEGRSIRQKLKKKMLINLQSDTAMVLKMERGKEYVKGMHPRPKRLNTYEYKAHKKEESKTVRAKQKDLKEDIIKLKKKLQKKGAKREQYAQLEQLNKDLKAKIKAKDLTIEEMQEQLDQLDINLLTKGKETTALEEQNQALKAEIKAEIKAKDTVTTALEEQNQVLKAEIKAEIKAKDTETTALEEQNQVLKAEIATLPSSDTLKELKTLKIDSKELQTENRELQTENRELWELAYEEDYETVLDEYGLPHDKTFTYKERYENSLVEIEKMEKENRDRGDYIKELDKGYQEIERLLFGEAKMRSIEDIVTEFSQIIEPVELPENDISEIIPNTLYTP